MRSRPMELYPAGGTMPVVRLATVPVLEMSLLQTPAMGSRMVSRWHSAQIRPVCSNQTTPSPAGAKTTRVRLAMEENPHSLHQSIWELPDSRRATRRIPVFSGTFCFPLNQLPVCLLHEGEGGRRSDEGPLQTAQFLHISIQNNPSPTTVVVPPLPKRARVFRLC